MSAKLVLRTIRAAYILPVPQAGSHQFPSLTMSDKNDLATFFNRKDVRLTLAGVCGFFALAALIQLLAAQDQYNLLRGAGGFLLWGGWAVLNALKPYGKEVPNINVAINIGLALVVASWLIPN